MARMNIPDVPNTPEHQKYVTKSNDGDRPTSSFELGQSTNGCPVILTPDQYIEMFGDSGDDNDSSFQGFEEDLYPIKATKIVPDIKKSNARRFFKRQLSPTDESNPYKKKYLSYTKDRSKSDQGELANGRFPKSLPDKENKLCLSNDCQQRTYTINKTAKNLVNKAYMVKRKTLICPLNVTPKCNRIARPKRKQKLNFNSDFVYDPPSKKQRSDHETETVTKDSPVFAPTKIKTDETESIIRNPSPDRNIFQYTCEILSKYQDSGICHEDKSVEMSSSNNEVISKEDKGDNTFKKDVIKCDGSDFVEACASSGRKVAPEIGKDTLKKKKKVRIKNASVNVSNFKKKVKVKNISFKGENNSPYQLATFSDLPLTQVKEEPSSPSNLQYLQDGNFTSIFPRCCDGENVTKAENEKNAPIKVDLNCNNKLLKEGVLKTEESSDDDFDHLKNISASKSSVQKKISDQPYVVLTDYLSDSNFNSSVSHHQKLSSDEKTLVNFDERKCEQGDSGKGRITHKSDKTVDTKHEENIDELFGNVMVSKYPRRDSIIKREKLSYVEGILQLDDDLDDFEEDSITKVLKSKSLGRNDVEGKQFRGRPCKTNNSKKENANTTRDNVDNDNDISKKKKRSSNPLMLKVIRKNSQLQMLNLNNQLITFCGDCDNCRKDKDCGTCSHCRNHKSHTVRLLPCWQRRCLNPIIGEEVDLKKRNKGKLITSKTSIKKELDVHSTMTKKTTASSTSSTKAIAASTQAKNKQKEKDSEDIIQRNLEKVEVCLVSDNPIISASKEGDEIQFQVHHSQKKTRKKDLSNSDIDVFTGMSPIKPKLRSTMNELISRTDPMDLILPRVEFGPETLAKLPWPNDTEEDAAWTSGHHICLTTAMELDLWNLCFLCGSAGKEKMVICNFCCECFHPYCLDVDPLDYKNWYCDRCKRCVVCGFKENLLMCDKCHDCYHADCLGPFYQRDTEGDEETWICGKCVKCSKCGQRRAGKVKDSKWMFDFTMCEECGTNWNKGNYCPLCLNIYGDHDDHLKMMCCCQCDQWIHMECEGISIDEYEILTDLPDSIPYVCKICTGKDKRNTTWYNEVQEELNGGFLKVYYDVTSHKDLKLIKKQLGEVGAVSESLEMFDGVFNSIEQCKFSCISEFHMFVSEAIKQLSQTVKEVAVADIPSNLYPNIDRLQVFFEKALKNLFSWFSCDHVVPAEKKLVDLPPLQIGLIKNKEVVFHDHLYAKKQVKDNKEDCSSLDESEEWAFNVLLHFEKPSIKKSPDMRRCIFCNQFGDGDVCNTGRLLYAGLNEWVHINCALWSAEVYEDNDGRLKHVHDALKRGNKLKCERCNQLGATIGCCYLKCPKSYHFYCASQSGVVFLDDKKIYCEAHGNKANKNLILTAAELSVPRRVVVDLTRFKSLKRVQRGLDPKLISVFCGGFSLDSLGALSEHSDVKRALIPAGYRVTRIFWSHKRPSYRCKYTCEVHVMRNKVKKEVEKEITDLDNIGETKTYCHDEKEWQQIKEKIICKCDAEPKPKSKKGTKPKVNRSSHCEKCLANQKYFFQKHSVFSKAKEDVHYRGRLATEKDHNFFPIKKSENDSSIVNTSCSRGTELKESDCTKTNDSKVNKLFSGSIEDMTLIKKQKSSSEIPGDRYSCENILQITPSNCQPILKEKDLDKVKTTPNEHHKEKIVDSVPICNEKLVNVTSKEDQCVSVTVKNIEKSQENGAVTSHNSVTSVCTCAIQPTSSSKVIYQSCIVNNNFSVERLLSPSTSAQQTPKKNIKTPYRLPLANDSTSRVVNNFNNEKVQPLFSLWTPTNISDNKNINNISDKKCNSYVDVISVCPVVDSSPCHYSASEMNVTYTKVIKSPNSSVKDSYPILMPTTNMVDISSKETSEKRVPFAERTFTLPNVLKRSRVFCNNRTISSAQSVLPNDIFTPGTVVDSNILTYDQKSYKKLPVTTVNCKDQSSYIPYPMQGKSRYDNIDDVSKNDKKQYIQGELLKMRNNLYNKISQSYKHNDKPCVNQFAWQQPPRLINLSSTSSSITDSSSMNTCMSPTNDLRSYMHTYVNHQKNVYSSPSLYSRSNSVKDLKNIVLSSTTYPLSSSVQDKAIHNVPFPVNPSIMQPMTALAQTSLCNDYRILNDSIVSKQTDFLNSKSPLHTCPPKVPSSKVERRISYGTEQVKDKFDKYPVFRRSLEIDRLAPKSERSIYEPLQEKECIIKAPLGNISNPKLKTSLDFKRDLLFRQLKEYLTKHPNVINLVGNVATKDKEGHVPIVNLTEPKSNRDSLCYSVYLPEHLWNDLVEAGIATNDIQKILQENSLQNQYTIPPSPQHENGYIQDKLPQLQCCPTNLYSSPLEPRKQKILFPTPIRYTHKYQKTFSHSDCNTNQSSALKSIVTISQNCIVSPSIDQNNLINCPTPFPQRSSVSQIINKNESFSFSPLSLPHRNVAPDFNKMASRTFDFSNRPCTSVSCSPSQTTLPKLNYISSIAACYKSNHSFDTSLTKCATQTLTKNSSQKKSYASSIMNYPCNQLVFNPSSESLFNCVDSNVNGRLSNLTGNIPHIPSERKILPKELPLFPATATSNSQKNGYCCSTFSFLTSSAFTNTNTGSCYSSETISPSINFGMNLTPIKPKRKYKKQNKGTKNKNIEKNGFSDYSSDLSHAADLADKSNSIHSSSKAGPVKRKKKEKKDANISADTEIDFCTFETNIIGDNFFDTTFPFEDLPLSPEQPPKKKKYTKKQKRNYLQSLKNCLDEQELNEQKKSETSLKFIVRNEDGWEHSSSSLLEIWKALIAEINEKRMEIKLSPFQTDINDAYEFIGVTKEFIAYLVEQLPGGHKCRNYKFQHHLPCLREDDNDLPINPKGCARAEIVVRNAEKDMFAWLASPYRIPPKYGDEMSEEEVLGGAQDLPVAMKYRFLKNTSKDHVGVFRSKIQGRGLYCKKTIDAGDMIIEYTGELIRASLTDRREEFYEKQGIGCYMFRIDDMEVVDATMKGNPARFINHSCEPNCYSKIITVDGSKKIVIFALRRIFVGEELTYDYKFSHEDDKLPCYCGAKKCRKYMN